MTARQRCYHTLKTAAWLLLLLSMPALAADRVALVIGNDAYATLPDLRNARRDARGMAARLQAMGFETTLRLDVTRRDLYDALDAFETALRQSNVGLVYYAGHGIQTEAGRNYLIPSDARIEKASHLRAEGVRTDTILELMEGAASRVSILILDACRDNPLPGGARSVRRGLARLEPSGNKDSAVIYSAGPGQVAQDGPAGGHGIFTGELLKALDQPGLTLDQVFSRVVRGVRRLTNDRQRPWKLGSMGEDFYFNRVASLPPSPSLPPDAVELVYWESIKDSTNPADFKSYVRKYPQGHFVELARNRIAALEAEADAVREPPPAVSAEAVETELQLSRADRRMIQLGLLAKGFDLGQADGLIGNRTRAALRQWQASREETVTGYLDVASAKVLLAAGQQREAEEKQRRAAAEAERLKREREMRQRAQRQAKENARRKAEEAERQRRQRQAQEKASREAEERRKWEKLGLVMVRVEGGSFVMGCQSSRDGECSHREKPPRQVQVPSFEIGKYEVTEALWKAVMGGHRRFRGCAKCPAASVDWHSVQRFLAQLNARTGKQYRLPSEAEWEYAARGGRKSRGYRYAGGNDAESVGWYNDNSSYRARPVGRKRANELGLFDMSGNVWEWTQDCRNASYRGAPANARAWEKGNCNRRVIRGGSRDYGPSLMRVAIRLWTKTRYPDFIVGFRVARTLPP